MPQDVRRPPTLPPKLVPPPPRDVDGVMRKSRFADAHEDDNDDWPPNGTSHRHGAGGMAFAPAAAEDDENARFSAAAGDGNRLHDRRSLTAETARDP